MLRPILIADDSEEDIVCLIRSLQRNHVENPIHSVPDAEGLRDYLLTVNGSPPPALIFIDARMPEVDGLSALEWIHEHPKFRSIPVVIITSDLAPLDTHKAYRLGAVSVLLKDWTTDLIKQLPPVATQLLRFSSTSPN